MNFGDVLRCMSQAVVVVDRDGQTLYANPAADSLLDLSGKPVHPRTLTEIVRIHDSTLPARVADAPTLAFNQGSANLNVVLANSAGEARPCSIDLTSGSSKTLRTSSVSCFR